jgi:hypothetical protein
MVCGPLVSLRLVVFRATPITWRSGDDTVFS